MYTLVIAAVFKNEALIFKEWINFHIKWGIEHFYLVDNYSTDNYLEIIKDYPVTLFQNNLTLNKSNIYEHYFKELPSKWVALLDLDEFLWSPIYKNIQEILDDSFSQIKIDCLHFGSSGHIIQPESVVKSFTKRAKFNKNNFYKSIYQTKYLCSFGIYGHIVNGQTVQLNTKLIINRYPIQSFNFFMTIKSTRKDWSDRNGYKRDKTYFIYQDINEIEDLRLSNIS
jgi:hypothetical protein